MFFHNMNFVLLVSVFVLKLIIIVTFVRKIGLFLCLEKCVAVPAENSNWTEIEWVGKCGIIGT